MGHSGQEVGIKMKSRSSVMIASRGGYAGSIALFILLWGALGLCGKYVGGWGSRVEYYGSMLIVFAWATTLRMRLDSAGKRMGALVPFMIAALLIDFLLIKLKLVGLSLSVLLCLFLVQLPALFWPSRKEAG